MVNKMAKINLRKKVDMKMPFLDPLISSAFNREKIEIRQRSVCRKRQEIYNRQIEETLATIKISKFVLLIVYRNKDSLKSQNKFQNFKNYFVFDIE